jgi:hypothetical protein
MSNGMYETLAQADKFMRLRVTWCIDVLTLLVCGDGRVTQGSFETLIGSLKKNMDIVCIADACVTQQEAWINFWLQLCEKSGAHIAEACKAMGCDSQTAQQEATEEPGKEEAAQEAAEEATQATICM